MKIAENNSAIWKERLSVDHRKVVGGGFDQPGTAENCRNKGRRVNSKAGDDDNEV